MRDDTKPEYWNERAGSDGRLAVVRKGYNKRDMERVTNQWWEKLKPFFTDKGKVLEVGCGWGRWAPYIEGVGNAYSGVDVSEELYECRREGYDIQLIDPGIIPFDSNTFDMVTCITVLQHIEDSDMVNTIAEMLRVLKPGGSLLAVENTTNMPRFRTTSEYKDVLPGVEIEGEIKEGRETMTIFYNEIVK